MRNLGTTLTPHSYHATFVRAGTLGNPKNALFVSVCNSAHSLLCSHLWVNWCDDFDRLVPGDVVTFTATPYRYIKGCPKHIDGAKKAKHTLSDFTTDVSLTDFTDIRVVGHNPNVEQNVREGKKKLENKGIEI